MNENRSGIIWVIVIVAGIWIWSNYSSIDKLKEENAILMEENYSFQQNIYDCDMAIDEANNNIEEANSNIENAKFEVWESYEDMGYALDGLETIYTVEKTW